MHVTLGWKEEKLKIRLKQRL